MKKKVWVVVSKQGGVAFYGAILAIFEKKLNATAFKNSGERVVPGTLELPSKRGTANG